MENKFYSCNFFLSLLENSTDLISIIDAEGYYKFVGGSVKSILGYTPEEMVGLCAFSYIHEEDQPATIAALCSGFNQNKTLLPNFRFRTKSGEWRWLECTMTSMVTNPDILGYVTNSRDITERVEEEQRKNKSQAHYESLFYNHPDAVFELDREGFFSKINRRVSEITGYSDAQILHSHFENFVHADDMPKAMDAFISALSGNSQYLELTITRKNGEIRYLGTTIVPVSLNNTVVSIQCIAKDITLHKRYDATIKEQAELLKSIMAKMPACFFTLDPNWCFTYVNAVYATFLDKSQADLQGKNIWELFPEVVGTKFHQECLQVALTGQAVSFTEHYQQLNGYSLSFQIFPSGRGIAVHFVDITGQKQEEERWEKLSLVASKTTTCVMIMDAQERIEWINEAFEKVMGYCLDECYLKTPAMFWGEADAQANTQLKIRNKTNQGKAFKGEILNFTKEGHKVWFYLETTPVFHEDGILSKIISIRTDITEKKQREQELMQLARDLFKQNRDLQQFNYMVSHNLRAPAANIMGLTDILTQLDKNSEMFDESLGRIKLSVNALDNVIRDMTHILSVRDHNFALERQDVNIYEVCQEVFSALLYKLDGCPHTFSLNIDKNFILQSNKTYLFEILKNLFSNAIKFRAADEMFKLELRLRQKENYVELLVKDNGIGMDMPAVKNDLFKLYKKFHKGYQGRGIGLFLTKTYVDALGGSIKLDSAPAAGTTFKIKLKHYAE